MESMRFALPLAVPPPVIPPWVPSVYNLLSKDHKRATSGAAGHAKVEHRVGVQRGWRRILAMKCLLLALSVPAVLSLAPAGVACPEEPTQGESGQVEPKGTLWMITEEGQRPLGSYQAHGNFLAPLTSLSPEVTRAEFIRGELNVEVRASGEAPEVVATALLHGRDEFVVLDGERPQVVRNALAPADATTGGQDQSASTWDLAHLIRRDQNCVHGGTVVITPPKASAESMLLLFGRPHQQPSSGVRMGWGVRVDGVKAFLPADPLRPLVLEAGNSPITIELGDAWLDAAMFVTPATPLGSLPLARTDAGPKRPDSAIVFSMGDELEARLDEPETAMTLWLRVDSAGPEASSRDAGDRANVESQAPSFTPVTPPATDVLVDSTFDRGLHAVHFEGEAEQLDIRPTMGPGAAWGDVDGDGWLDLVVLQGGGRPGTALLPDRLYRGTESGRFEDITERAHLGRGDAGMGALLADINGDGHLDLYCANYGQDRLFQGKGDGTFEERTNLLPELDLYSASVTAADYDGDGDLDLYITSYLDYDLEKMPPAEELGRYQREDPIVMLPFAFPGQRNVFLKNLTAETGELAFEDVTESLGMLDVQGRGMQSVFWDFDRDGDEDLYVANDVSFNVLFRNEGDGTFKDVSFSTGLDDPRGGMGLAVGDVDLDGDEDVFLTNWQLETNALYLNSVVSHKTSKRRRASFHDYTVRSGLGPSGIGRTSWGAELFDLDLDGDLDLYVANGYTSPDYESTGICVGQTDQLFLGDGTGKFKAPKTLPAALDAIIQSSRGAIGADFDRDGDVDLLVTANNGRVVLLENRAPRLGRWTGVRLLQKGLNTRAIGAEVVVTLENGQVQRRSVRAGQGYLTGNAPEVHFGLGKAAAIRSIEVVWPDGVRTQHVGQLDAWQTITRG